MENRIIVENRAGISDADALRYVIAVIDEGRISNNGRQYCYATTFGKPGEPNCIAVWTDLNKRSDRFVVSSYPYPESEAAI